MAVRPILALDPRPDAVSGFCGSFSVTQKGDKFAHEQIAPVLWSV
jgi:hypothetical protein